MSYLKERAEYLTEVETKENYKIAAICATIANSSGRYKKHLKVDDFLTKPKRKATQEIPAQMDTMKTFCKLVGGK